jgi:hypothetical protein
VDSRQTALCGGVVTTHQKWQGWILLPCVARLLRLIVEIPYTAPCAAFVYIFTSCHQRANAPKCVQQYTAGYIATLTCKQDWC